MLKSGKAYQRMAQDIINDYECEYEILPRVDGEPNGCRYELEKDGKTLLIDNSGRPWYKNIIPATGFWQYLDKDSLIHPAYVLHRTVTGRCLTADTYVVTNHGVLSLFEFGERWKVSRSKKEFYVVTHRNRLRRVTDFICNGSREVFKVVTQNGTIKATANHPVLTPSGWRLVSELVCGDDVYSSATEYAQGVAVEVWKRISGSNYDVSNTGRVRSLGTKFNKPVILKPYFKGKWGHVRVRLGAGGKDIGVHRLVALAFIGNPPSPKQEVCHLNGLPADNRVENLRWGTSKTNGQQMIAMGRSRRGTASNQSVLTENDVSRIRSMREDSGLYYGTIASIYGVSESLIRGICHGRRWKSVFGHMAVSKVLSIIPAGIESTFDISVEEDHSFIANGIFVHNSASQNPNGQNIPKRGSTPRMKELVSAYRRCFVAKTGCKFIECVAEDELVNTDRGLYPIREVEGKVYTGSNFYSIVGKRYVGEREVVHVQASDGSKVRVTKNHPFLVVRGGQYAWVEAGNLLATDYLCVPDHKPEHSLLSVKAADEAYWVGYFIGDGYYSKQSTYMGVSSKGGYYRINFALGLDMRELFGSMENFFGTPPQVKPKGDVCVQDKQLYKKWVARYPKKNSWHAEIPKCILESDIDTQLRFLAGLIDSDGSYHARRMTYVSVSEKLIRQIHTMCRRLGIHGLIRRVDDGCIRAWAFDVFEAESLGRLPEGLLKRKRDRKRKYCSSKMFTQCRTAMVPLGLIEAYKEKGMQCSVKANRLFSNARRRGHATRDAVRRAGIEKFAPFLNYRYLGVDSVVPSGMAKVYDIEVARDHRFEVAGFIIHNCDLSQAELRLAAWMSNDHTMLQIYRDGGDIHASTAARSMNLTMEQFMALPADDRKMGRFRAKAVNFGFLYGMWWKGFMSYAKTEYGIDLTEKEAEAAYNTFFNLYSGLQGWHKGMKDFAQSRGYVRAMHGALRRLPSVNSDDEGVVSGTLRQAINSPIQRMASDLALIGKTRFVRDCPRDLVWPAGFVHDSVILEVREEHAEEMARAAKWYMQTPPLMEWFGIESPIPLLADVAIGLNLDEMEERPDLEAVMPVWAKS